MTGVRQLPALLAVLRHLLRDQRITQDRLSGELGVGLATIKRWLTGRGLTIERLEAICLVAGVSLTDLLERVGDVAPSQLQELSLGQERALAADARLTFLFFSILNGWSPEEFGLEFQVPSATLEDYLYRLQRLALIERLRSGSVRPLASRQVRWRRGGPLAQHFDAEVKKLFLDSDFADTGTVYHSDVAKLSDSAISQLQALLQQFQSEFHRIAELDRRALTAERRWIGILHVIRTIQPDLLNFNGPRISREEAD